MSKVSTKARAEMTKQMAAFEAAASDVRDLFERIAPYRAAVRPEDLPMSEWTPDHFGLLLFSITEGSPRLQEQVRRMTMENPAEFMSLIATVFRVGYAARQYEPPSANGL